MRPYSPEIASFSEKLGSFSPIKTKQIEAKFQLEVSKKHKIKGIELEFLTTKSSPNAPTYTPDAGTVPGPAEHVKPLLAG